MTETPTKATFLGREAELAALLGGLDETEAGRGGLVLVGGEPGIGKSRLADEVSSHARDRGFVALWGRGWEDAGAPPYWPWVQVLRSYVRQTDADTVRRQLGPGAVDIAQMLPEIHELVPDLEAPSAGESDAARFQLFDSTATFLRAAGLTRPLMVVLDDLQAADPSSLRLLGFLTSQLGDMRVLIVGTYRDVELSPDHPLTIAMADLVRAPIARAISLSGLGRDALRSLIGATTGTAPDEHLVAAMARGTKGNPLFAHEALRLLSAEGRLDELASGPSRIVAVPPGVRAVIARRLERLAAPTRSMLTIGAVVGPEFDAELIGAIGDSDGTPLEDALDEAVREGLLGEAGGVQGRYRFSHDLIRETLYDELSPGSRRRLHRRVADSLENGRSDAPESRLAELAHHFFESERDPVADRKAVEYARRAGVEASRSLAFEDAARLYRIALAALERSATSDPKARLEILLALGDALNRGGEIPAARGPLIEASELAKAQGAPRELALAAVGLGGRMPWSRPGRESKLIPLLQDALVHLGGTDDALRVRLLTRLACALRSSPERRAESDALSRQAVELARSIENPAALTYALAGRFWAIWWPENPEVRLDLAREMFELAAVLGDGERLIDAQMMLWLSHTELADMTAARRESNEMRRLVVDLRQPGHLWLGISPRALMALMEGDFAAAEQLIGEETDPESHFTLARDNISAARFHRFLLQRERGQLAGEELEVRSSVDEFPWYPLHRSALACLLVELGRTGEARGVLQELARDDFAALYPDNEWLLGTSLAAEAVARLNEAELAQVLYLQLQPLAGRHAIGHAEGSIGAVDRYLGLLAACLDRLDDAARHLEDAVHINERMGARPWTAHSRFDLATVLSRRDAPGDRPRAADLNALALAAARELGMPVLESRILAAESGAPSSASDGATGTFRHEGDFWTIAFEGDGFRIKDSKGIAYLARLLVRPGQEFHALDLAGSRAANPAPSALGELRVGTEDGAGPMLDEAAKAAYRARVEELRSEIAQGEEWNDTERAAQARAELEALTSELAAAVGLGGRDRQSASATERARVSVTRAIRSAIDRVSAESPALGNHLEATIRTGTYCSYTPDPRAPITWRS